jgi:hypothetical protein
VVVPDTVMLLWNKADPTVVSVLSNVAGPVEVIILNTEVPCVVVLLNTLVPCVVVLLNTLVPCMVTLLNDADVDEIDTAVTLLDDKLDRLLLMLWINDEKLQPEMMRFELSTDNGPVTFTELSVVCPEANTLLKLAFSRTVMLLLNIAFPSVVRELLRVVAPWTITLLPKVA